MNDDQSADKPIKARPATVLNCQAGQELSPHKRPCVVLSFGHVDGSIDQLELSVEDATKLLSLLVTALHLPKPANSVQWLVPHSVLRAQLHIGKDLHADLYQLRERMPEVEQFVTKELAAF